MSAPIGLSEFSIALKAGTLLVDQYTIVGVLGRPGGFGITYLAEDIRLDTLVAIKEFLPRELATRAPDRSTIITHSGDHDSSFHRGLEQFLREARTLAKIHHPSVVRVRQFFEANGTAYLVMDYLEGQTLSELVREAGGRLPAPRAVEIIMRVLEGLRAAHALNIYHRDVKPANIYITASGLPVLLDFGAARQATGTSGASMTAVLTPGFAPLEQYGHRGQGPWTDIYATAAVLYFILTGVDPVPATDRVGDENDPMVSPMDIDPRIGEALSDAVMKGLSMAPRGRPQTAPEYQEMLKEALAEHQRATTAPPMLPALPPETIRPTPVEVPRVVGMDVTPRSTPKASLPPRISDVPPTPAPASDESRVVVSFKMPRRMFGLSLKVALSLTVTVGVALIAFVATRWGGAPVNSVAVTGPDSVTAQSDSAERYAQTVRRADSIRVADSLAALRTADSVKQAGIVRSKTDSIERLRARRDDSLRQVRRADSLSRAALAQKRADSLENERKRRADSLDRARRADSLRQTLAAQKRADSLRADSTRRANAAKTFSAGVDAALRSLADLFRSRDRPRIAMLFGDDEAERILQRLQGHPQIKLAHHITGLNETARQVEFSLSIEDQTSGARLLSDFYIGRFAQMPTGWQLLTARRR
jgi:serine/threonine protein kinase